MGCRATQVQTIEEGITPQSQITQEFWTILGGQTTYQRKTYCCLLSGWWLPLGALVTLVHICVHVISLQLQVHRRPMSSLRMPFWKPTVSSDCWRTNWFLTMTSGGRSLVALYWSPRRLVGLYWGSQKTQLTFFDFLFFIWMGRMCCQCF